MASLSPALSAPTICCRLRWAPGKFDHASFDHFATGVNKVDLWSLRRAGGRNAFLQAGEAAFYRSCHFASGTVAGVEPEAG